MPAKEKVIGFKVSEESKLAQRMKKLIRITGKKYGELLEKWVSSEEVNLGGSLFEQPDGTLAPVLHDTRIEAMEKQIADLTAKLEVANSAHAQLIETPAMSPETAEEVASVKLMVSELAAKVQALEKHGADAPTVGGETEEEDAELVGDSYEETKLYILELWQSGKNNTEIAELLNAEGRPTKSGEGYWYPASVGTVLKVPKQEKADKEAREKIEAEMEEDEAKFGAVPDRTSRMIDVAMKKGIDIDKIEAGLGIEFVPDPPKPRRGRPKKAKA